jgi:hypothetical protein
MVFQASVHDRRRVVPVLDQRGWDVSLRLSAA